MRWLLPIFAGLAVDAFKTEAKTSAIGHYAKVIKVFEDMYSDRKKELEKTESDKKELTCGCDKSIAAFTEEMAEATENQGYWQGQAEADRTLMQAADGEVQQMKKNINDKSDEIRDKSAGCQETQAVYQEHLQTMQVQLAHTTDAQTLVGQHLGKHVALDGTSFMQTGEHKSVQKAHSQAYSDADARIFTPDLKNMIADLMVKTNVHISPEDLTNVMGFLQAPTRKIAHAFAQTGKKKLEYCAQKAGAGGTCGNPSAESQAACEQDGNCEWTMVRTVENATFEAIWNLLQGLVKQINEEITTAQFDKEKHASACQNWVNILQVEVDTYSATLEKSAENYDMYSQQFGTAMNNMAQAQTQMDALEGDGTEGTLTWDKNANSGNGAFTGTNAKGDIGGCEDVGAAAHTTACFDATNTAAWPGDNADAATKAAAYQAVFTKCENEGRATNGQPPIAQCTSCGFSLAKNTKGSLVAPQRCRMKHMQCGRSQTEAQARIDVLVDEMAALSEAKQIMYQKEADFHAASKFENALFFLQTDEEANQPYGKNKNSESNADLKPVVDKIVELINGEQDKRATNAWNYNSCNIQISDLKNDVDVAESMVRALKDKVQAYSEDVTYYKDAVRQLTTDLNDIENAIHKLYNEHQDELVRLEDEISQMQPLIDTVDEVKSALLGDSVEYPHTGFAQGDQIIVIVDRLKADLVHEKAQLENEKSEAQSDYANEDQDLADQKLSVLQRRGDQQGQMATARQNLGDARTDLGTAKTTAQDEYEEYHQKSVECAHLLSKFNEIQAALDDHIGQLRQMLGLFTNLAKLPDATKQLHVSSYNYGCKAKNVYSMVGACVVETGAVDSPNTACASRGDETACMDFTGDNGVAHCSWASNPVETGDQAICADAGRMVSESACTDGADGAKCEWKPTYSNGWQSSAQGLPSFGPDDETAERVSNHDYSSTPNNGGTATQTANYPGDNYLGNAQNPVF